MATGHAYLAPSSAGIWGPGGCPGQPRMASAFPEDGSTAEAREGEAAHWLLEENVRGRTHPIGAAAPNGVLVTDEMIEGVAQMVGDIYALRVMVPDLRWCLEASLQMPQVHPTLNWGRTDFGAVDAATRTIHVWDFKFGHGYVDAFENWQALDYGQGIANYFDIDLQDPGWSVEMRIYQPRSFHAEGPVKIWRIRAAKFQEYIRRLSEAAHIAAEPDAPLSTGKHCEYCSARHACPALRRVGGLAVDISLQGVPAELNAEDAGLALRMVRTARERLEDLETGLEAQIMAQLRGGAANTGFEIYQGQGREKWSQPVADVVAMGAVFGHDLSKPAEAITPAQARKKGIDETVISQYSYRPTGEFKIRPVDDKSIRKAFSS